MPETPAPYDATGGQPARPAVIEAFVAAFERLMHSLSQVHAPDLLGTQLTMSQTKVLYVVLAAGQVRMSVLASRLGVALSTISGVVDRLVDLGMIDRRDDPADRRQVMVTVTARGAAEIDRLRELNEAELRTLLQFVDDADVPVLLRAVEILIEAAARAAQPVQPKPAAQSPSSAPTPAAGALS